MSSNVIKVLANFTKGQFFSTQKQAFYELPSELDYDDHAPETGLNNVGWKEPGETEIVNEARDIREKAHKLVKFNNTSLFTYFLDGSRHVYKICDISYEQKQVYPIIAGQIGIACCRRVNKEMHLAHFEPQNVLVLPSKAFDDLPKLKRKQIESCLQLVNEQIQKTASRNGLVEFNLDQILCFDAANRDEKYLNAAIAQVNTQMQEAEKKMMFDLATAGNLDQDHYLIKDGSLEYSRNKESNLNLSNPRVRNAFQYVIGVSKSFNPSLLVSKQNNSNANFIASLKVGQRTPVARYRFERGDASLAIWYLRIHDRKYTTGVFNGVVKLEKVMLDNDATTREDSETIDTISAHVFNERNPVCYGADSRWANHLYPVYITEKYAKSRYLSDTFFENLF